ncbi:MAG: ABC transporter permease [Pararobbsia sp.]
MKIVVLWTDAVMFAVLAAVIAYGFKVARTPHLAATWRKAFMRPSGAAAATLLAFFVLIGLLDSLHYRPVLADTPGSSGAVYSPVTRSVLDDVLRRQQDGHESSYSEPLAYRAYAKEASLVDGQTVRAYPRLRFGGASLRDPARDWGTDVATRTVTGLLAGLVLSFAIASVVAGRVARTRAVSWRQGGALVLRGATPQPWRAVLGTLTLLLVLGGMITALALEYHVFGTDRVGNDLLYVVFKSIRTAVVIGTMSTLVTMPIAVGLGITAGYLRGWIDEVIQYVYTVINSIPYVLLIAASVLILMVFIDTHPDKFPTLAQRTDARLFFLCLILGLTSWTDLCRLIRSEVIKLREAEYIQAARAFGVGTWRILAVHLVPNVMHLILISIAINFSGLVLAEAVLSYVGVGVDPAMQSFGTLINAARLELAQQPAIWWTLTTAFVFMFALVLAANVLADAIRDAFDPKAIHR